LWLKAEVDFEGASMNIPVQTLAPPKVVYPDSDGQRMADNTLQFRWIVTLQGNLDALFRHDPNVFVAGDLLWYPIEGDNQTCVAPDVMVVFGRPKGYRGSYQQWREGNIPPHAVFEVLSPSNRLGETIRKFEFYQRHGVEEYYVYDPDRHALSGWIRRRNAFEEIVEMNGWISPRLGIRFELSDEALNIYAPNGQRFATYIELFEEREQERQRAEQERDRADQERQRADQERQRAERLAAQLKALGVQPEP
jgi:Uma2 family endonuclease